MRYMIDRYIEADRSKKISPFDNIPLLDLIVKTGIADAITEKLAAIKDNQDAVAETIENNVRSTIIRKAMVDPAYYERMSALLAEIIALRKAKALEYAAYLQQIAELARQVEAGQADHTPEPLKKSPALRAIYNNLPHKPPKPGAIADEPAPYTGAGDPRLALAIQIDEIVRRVRPDDFRGNEAKERVIKRALYALLNDKDEVERIFLIIKAQQEY
jgi:type I restriction enzyme R subunit